MSSISKYSGRAAVAGQAQRARHAAQPHRAGVLHRGVVERAGQPDAGRGALELLEVGARRGSTGSAARSARDRSFSTASRPSSPASSAACAASSSAAAWARGQRGGHGAGRGGPAHELGVQRGPGGVDAGVQAVQAPAVQ